MTTACIPLPFGNPYFVQTNSGVSDSAKALDLFVSKELTDCSHSIVIGKNEILHELYSLAEECSVENWDGYGAQPIDYNSFNEAERFIQSLPTTIKQPELSVDPDGEISIEWYLEPRMVFSVSVGSRNEISYAGLFGPNKTYGQEYFGDEIPKAIFDNLERLFS